jgi:hypothetical protein
MVPGWRLTGDAIEPDESTCDHWREFQIRVRLESCGVPKHLINKRYDEHPKDQDLILKLRACLERGLFLCFVGALGVRARALLTMTRCLAKQKRRRHFRVEILDISFRQRVDTPNSTLMRELQGYPSCLFVVFMGIGSFPAWMMNDFKEVLSHRAMNRLPTVVMEETTAIHDSIKGMGEVIGCRL